MIMVENGLGFIKKIFDFNMVELDDIFDGGEVKGLLLDFVDVFGEKKEEFDFKVIGVGFGDVLFFVDDV